MLNFGTLPHHWVNRFGFALRRDLVERFRAAGLAASAEEWGAMLILSQGPCTPGALSDQTLRDRTTVTRLVDRMVARGVVLRETDPKDRRRHTLRLTREGYTEFADMARIAEGLIAQTCAGLSAEDIDRTTDVLKTMFLNLTGGQRDDGL